MGIEGYSPARVCRLHGELWKLNRATLRFQIFGKEKMIADPAPNDSEEKCDIVIYEQASSFGKRTG